MAEFENTKVVVQAPYLLGVLVQVSSLAWLAACLVVWRPVTLIFAGVSRAEVYIVGGAFTLVTTLLIVGFGSILKLLAPHRRVRAE